MEFQVRFDSIANRGFLSQWYDGSHFWRVMLYSGDLRLELYNGATTITIMRAWAPSAETWYHVALVRSGNDWRFFIDGVQLGTTAVDSNSMADFAAPLKIGIDSDSGTKMVGYMDEVRISKGTDRGWTSNFTPPAEEYNGVVYKISGTLSDAARIIVIK